MQLQHPASAGGNNQRHKTITSIAQPAGCTYTHTHTLPHTGSELESLLLSSPAPPTARIEFNFRLTSNCLSTTERKEDWRAGAGERERERQKNRGVREQGSERERGKRLAVLLSLNNEVSVELVRESIMTVTAFHPPGNIARAEGE